MLAPARKVLLVSRDSALASSTRSVFGRSNYATFEHIDANVRDIVNAPQLADAALLIVDIDATNRDELVALQGIMTRFPGTMPVVVLTESFDDFDDIDLRGWQLSAGITLRY